MATRGRRASTKRRGDSRLRLIADRIGGYGPWWQRAIRWFAFLGVSGIVGGALTFFATYQMIDIPPTNAAFETQTTKVYYSDGKHQIGSFATQDRDVVPLDQIPATMQAAAIAAEDRSFYENDGIDVRGIIRAFRDNTTSGQIQGGGSTITQQYVKILYLTQERSYTRKIKEAVLSVKINNQRSKDEILEGYLNTIYFGNGAYGVEVASQTYFRKAAAKLSLPESALLATIINSPSYYDPYTEGAEDRIIPRYDYVLDGMVSSGAIDAAEAAEWKGKLPKVAKQRTNDRFGGTKGYLLDMVKRDLKKLQFTDQQIDGGGLRVVTTFDYEKQRAAEAAVKTVQPKGLDQLHTALVSVEPGSGAVRALYGGPDYVSRPFNWATAGTQPGSTFKVFAVVAALEDGYSLKTRLNGSSPLRIGSATIENQGDSGGRSFGPVNLTRATEQSVNTAFVDLVEQMADGGPASLGAQKVLAAANQAGVPTAYTKDPQLVSPLGFEPVPPIDMANAYATIAAGGKKSEWYIIEKVTDAAGTEAHQHEEKSEQAIPEDVAGDTIKAMLGVVSKGTGKSGRTICSTAGKTGTATAGEGPSTRVSSSWFAGFTPKLATAVMYNRGNGNEQLEGYLNPFYGGTYPARTFKAYMDAALQGEACGEFVKPGNIRSDKGKDIVEPPKCDDDEELSSDKTRCVPKPEPEPTETEPTLTPDTPPTPTVPTPTPTRPTRDPDCGGLFEPPCSD